MPVRRPNPRTLMPIRSGVLSPPSFSLLWVLDDEVDVEGGGLVLAGGAPPVCGGALGGALGGRALGGVPGWMPPPGGALGGTTPPGGIPPLGGPPPRAPPGTPPPAPF